MRRGLFLALCVPCGLLFFLQPGCSKDDDSDNKGRLSLKGEACQTSADCAAGLACLPFAAFTSTGQAGGQCVRQNFEIAATAKECALLQCEQPIDCCPQPSANCTSLQLACDDGGGSSFSCQQYEQQCRCDASKWDCISGSCKSRCREDSECSTNHCSAGRCVQCVNDSHCLSDQSCISGACQGPCKSDAECPGFDRCNAGKCTPGGCQTDRECVAATRNVEAKCGTDGKCVVPCETDLECGNPRAYSFFSCIDKKCTYTGCTSDKDCELYLTGGRDGATASGGRTRVVCRDQVK